MDSDRGSVGVGISPIGYGAWEAGGGSTWGPNTSRDDVLEVIRRSVAVGMTWIDTAEVYGGGGGSEEIVGEAIAGLQDVSVCTKVAPVPDDQKFTQSGLRQALEGSMERLRRDRIEIYLLHWPAEHVPVEQTWEAMARIREEGLARSIGLSNYSVAAVRTCARVAPIDYVQIQGSLLYENELVAFRPLCRQLRIKLLAYGPLAFGLLSDTIDENTVFDDWRNGTSVAHDAFGAENYSRFFTSSARRKKLTLVRRLSPIADSVGCTLPQLALGWLLSRPGVVAAAVGTRNRAHAAENAAAAELKLSKDVLLSIDEVLGRPACGRPLLESDSGA
jgi:methylglyoxal reductase